MFGRKQQIIELQSELSEAKRHQRRLYNAGMQAWQFLDSDQRSKVLALATEVEPRALVWPTEQTKKEVKKLFVWKHNITGEVRISDDTSLWSRGGDVSGVWEFIGEIVVEDAIHPFSRKPEYDRPAP